MKSSKVKLWEPPAGIAAISSYTYLLIKNQKMSTIINPEVSTYFDVACLEEKIKTFIVHIKNHKNQSKKPTSIGRTPPLHWSTPALNSAVTAPVFWTTRRKKPRVAIAWNPPHITPSKVHTYNYQFCKKNTDNMRRLAQVKNLLTPKRRKKAFLKNQPLRREFYQELDS